MGIEALPISPFQCWEEIGSDGSGESLELTSGYATRYEWQAERAGVRDGSPKGRDTVSVHDSPSPKGHVQCQVGKREVKTKLRGFFDGND